MYQTYYHLRLKPFQISTDPKFLWLGEKHKEALAILKYGVLDNKGFLLLTGDVGTGKTTLLNALLNSLGDEVIAAMVQDPGLGKLDFFNFIADAFEMPSTFKSKGEFLIQLKHFLYKANEQHKKVLLIIDECQRLNQKLLEEIRLLSNIEKQNTKLINIFFVGQDEFNEIILRPTNRAIRQRITINYTVEALSENETEKYIRYRLKVAGSNRTIITPSAVREIYKFSGGYPRLINIICDHALLTGYVNDQKKIRSEIIKECANELKIPYYTKPPDIRATPEADLIEEKPEVIYAPRVTAKSKMPMYLIFIIVLVTWLSIVGLFVLNSNKKPDIAAIVVPEEIRENSIDPITNHETSVEDEADGDKGEEPEETIIETDPSEIVEKTPEQNEKPLQAPLIEEEKSLKETIAAKEKEINVAEVDAEQQNAIKSEPVETLSLERIIEIYGPEPYVVFGFDSNSLENESYKLLDDVAALLNEKPEISLVLRGHTDNYGVRAYNIKLSEFRADIVKTYLIGKGIHPGRIVTIGLGPDEKTAEKVRPGRRVEIEIARIDGDRSGIVE